MRTVLIRWLTWARLSTYSDSLDTAYQKRYKREKICASEYRSLLSIGRWLVFRLVSPGHCGEGCTESSSGATRNNSEQSTTI
ncbi:hypothetical protein DFH05DRAFT_724955 [Lentinula detonsa]|uniref:Uncharacterized protein n=1 Tax=Lentinula detonsa TaxID=2804962 RepID=A0A9W8TSW4_9AGAR|nr:hypothetical protein DFH05DRAFT_724955 [Lentinula detonsa]